MKFNYYPETDSLYIDLSEKTGSDTREIAEGIVLDFDSEGHVVGIDIEHASRVANLTNLEVKSLPFRNIQVK